MSDITRAIVAATSVAVSLGLPADDAIVLHNSNRLALRLTPCDVFARVARVGQEVAQFEVELAGRLAGAGCPVGALEPRAGQRVYTRGGFAVTLWTYYAPVTPRVSPDGYASALERLHAGMREVDVPSPRFTDRIAEAEQIVASPDLSPGLAGADRVFLSARLASLRRAIEARGAVEQMLHGEPHPGNVLSTKNGPLFIDLETCCRGPVEFDLAHVPEAVCGHYPNVDQGLLDECRQLVLAMVAAWRWDAGDEFPNGRWFGEELLRLLREGPPWPTLDAVTRRLDGLEKSPGVTFLLPPAMCAGKRPSPGLSLAPSKGAAVSWQGLDSRPHRCGFRRVDFTGARFDVLPRGTGRPARRAREMQAPNSAARNRRSASCRSPAIWPRCVAGHLCVVRARITPRCAPRRPWSIGRTPIPS